MRPLPRFDQLGDYDVQQVCLNGHVITPWAIRQPTSRQAFCDGCGAKTITACEGCGAYLTGANWKEDAVDIFYRPPAVPRAFCVGCGKPYPWTQQRMDAALALAAEISDVDANEIERLRESIPNLAANTPASGLAVTRWKKLLARAGGEAGTFIRKLLGEIVTTEIKRHMGI